MPPVDGESAAAPVAKIAVVGAGWWSQTRHLPHLANRADAQVLAIVDPNPRPATPLAPTVPLRDLAAAHGAVAFRSVEEMLAHPLAARLDGVIVASPHAHHHAAGVAALGAGLHVLMEKPMATCVREARELAEAAAAASGRAFMVNNTANWRPQARVARECVASRQLGEVLHVACWMHAPLLFLFDNPENVGWTQPSGAMVANGFGYGQLSHLLAWVLHVSDLEPVEAYATMAASASSGADIADAVVIRCANGASISMSGTAAVPGSAHDDDASVGKSVRIAIFGDKGSLEYGGDDQRPASGRLEVRRREGGPSVVHDGFEFEDYAEGGVGPATLGALVDACLGRSYYNGADAGVGLRVVRALDAAYRSARSGRPEKAL